MDNSTDHCLLKIWRFDPQTDRVPRLETFSVPVTEEKMSLLQALEAVYRDQDTTLAFRRYCCGVQYCNSCLMLINGKPTHACITILHPGDEFEVAPLRGKEVLRDLIVDQG